MASGSSELELFVREALLRGQSRQAILSALIAAGWREEQVSGALAAYADVAFPVPVPRPRASVSPRDAFLYLVLFTTLYTTAWSLGRLWFDMLEQWLPDAAQSFGYNGRADSMRWSVAGLLIAFPVFAWLSRLLARDVAANPAKRLSSVRRWLTYLTLFITASVLICDLMVLVYNLLGGELSLRFVLKVLAIAVIAGTIFMYYLGDLRRDETENAAARQPRNGGRILWITAAVIAATIVAAFLAMGSPGKHRLIAIDRHRTADLQRLQSAVEHYYQQHDALPASLEALSDQPGFDPATRDPENGKPYRYRKLQAKRYELCASFATDTAVGQSAGSAGMDRDWAHGIGETCFVRTIKP